MIRIILLICILMFSLNAGESSIEASLSNFKSQTHQTIYYSVDGRKISELIWNIKNVKMLKLKLAYDMKNNRQLYISLSKNLTKGDGFMSDYDWVSYTDVNFRTHLSHHEDTRAEDISMFDLGFKNKFLIKHIEGWFSIGFKHESQKYSASNGNGVYPFIDITPTTTTKEISDSFKELTFSGKGITLTKKSSAIYFGLGSIFKYKNISFDTSLIYSPYTKVSFQDEHHFRDFIDRTYFDATTMKAVNIDIIYQLSKKDSIIFSLSYTKYDFIKGGRTRNYATGLTLGLPDSAGLESTNSINTLTYRYSFYTK